MVVVVVVVTAEY